ncbi:MAG: DUF503 domain-containing protein [Pseudomonadota bacterium]
MVVGNLQLSLYVAESRSLKEKRRAVRKIKDKMRNQFNVSIAEVGKNDDWKRIHLGVSAVGNEEGFVRSELDRVLRAIEGLYVAQVLRHQLDLVHYHADDFVGLEPNP